MQIALGETFSRAKPAAGRDGLGDEPPCRILLARRKWRPAPAGSMPLTRAGQASASPFRAYRALTDAAGSCGWAGAWTEIASGNAYCFGRSCAAPSSTVRSNASRSARNAMAPSPSTPRCRHAKRTRSSAADRTRNSLSSPAHIRQPRTCYGGPQLARKPCSCIGIVKWVGRLRGTVQTACL